ncbi:MAG TPA: DUF3189 family protein [Desulfotomaculum sp.]|nr:DUF3189 family protein [Desulfotomaculum sp.]
MRSSNSPSPLLMRLVYCDYQGVPLAAVAAGIRTGRLPSEEPLKEDELLRLPGISSPCGFVHYGRDEAGTEVYALWCRAEPAFVARLFRVREELYGEGEWSLRHVSGIAGGCIIALTWRLARLGSACGRRLFYRAVVNSYPRLLCFALEDLQENQRLGTA